jgi:hypothetical protein
LIVEKTLPVCTDCDHGCFKVKDIQIDTVIIDLRLEAGNRIRRFIDVSKYVLDWHLIDVEFTAILKENDLIIKKSSTGAGAWPWCK